MIRSWLKRRREARWARGFENGYQHASAWLLRGGSVEELLAQRVKWPSYREFDRGINCAIHDYRFLVGMGVRQPVISLALAA